MKGYLDLVPISAKVHRKQNRMSVFCIILAVFLVATIFGMADMFIRSQMMQIQLDDGLWHIAVQDITDADAQEIAQMESVESAARYGVLNYRGNEGYKFAGKDIIIAGADESYLDMWVDPVDEGTFPKNEHEAYAVESMRDMEGVQIGDTITVDGPEGDKLQYTVSGFFRNVPTTMREDSYGIFLTTETFRALFPPEEQSGNLEAYNSLLVVKFAHVRNIRSEIDGIKSRYHLSDEQVAENVKLFALSGQSRNVFIMQIYATAAVLFVLVMIAGIMMIAGSLNSNVSQRTQFFGLMRCTGATAGQVMRLVYREALRWCRTAVPVGIGAGIVVIWILCAVLRYLAPKYFHAVPVFGVSVPSIIMGTVVGVLTVLIAARTPAKRAAKVSPLAAVSGNAGDVHPVRKAANTRFFKVDTALGIHHAKASRKNLILMAGSFALSIIRFLSFYVTVSFMGHATRPMLPWTPDLSVISPDLTCSVDRDLVESLRDNPTVRRVYGRGFAYDVPLTVGDGGTGKADLISYEQNQFDWAKKFLNEGSLENAQSELNTGLIVYEEDAERIKVGDTVTLTIDGKEETIKIVGQLSNCPFTNDGETDMIICSEDTFRQVTGQENYTIIDVQLKNGTTDEEVTAIHQMTGTDYIFSDERLDNTSARGVYYCFALFIYGFLTVVAFIAVFNVINSIAMSVSARMKLYGAFRAIGLSTRQLAKMVVAEAVTYTAVGSLCGIVLGIISNKLLFGILVSSHWGDEWKIPFGALSIILIIVVLSVILAVHGPIRQIREMSVVDTISAQ